MDQIVMHCTWQKFWQSFILIMLVLILVGYIYGSTVHTNCSFQGKSMLLSHIQVEMLHLIYTRVYFWPPCPQPYVYVILTLFLFNVFSISDIFPPVSLNFAGGASMILRPQDYLIQQTSIVSIWAIIF